MIVMYSGRRGAGKTLSMVKDAINFYDAGWTIYSNFDISIPYKKLTNEQILDLPNNNNIKNCVLLMDEIQTIIDSRRSMKSGNLNFSYFIQQIRKRNIILLCTTQFSRTTDVRLREHVDIIVKPKILLNYPVVEATYYDLTSEEDLGFIETKVVVYNPALVWDLYDTNEIKDSVNIKSNKELLEEKIRTKRGL